MVVSPSRAMNIHEHIQMGILAGVNQVYAELETNLRDVKSHTEESRGFTSEMAG